MEDLVQKLLDIEEIKKVKYRYFRGIDMADMELLDQAFSEDVAVDYRGGDYRCAFEGKKDVLEFIANAFHSEAAACHQGHHPEIEITGPNSATGIWYLSDTFIDIKSGVVTRGSALYKDRYVREEGVWKIAFSEYDRIWEEMGKQPADTKITVRYLQKHGRQLKQSQG